MLGCAVKSTRMSLIVGRSIVYVQCTSRAWIFVHALAATRRLRTDKGWSQERFAFEAGIHRTYVSDIERGARNPTITVLEKLAKPLGVEPGRLLD